METNSACGIRRHGIITLGGSTVITGDKSSYYVYQQSAEAGSNQFVGRELGREYYPIQTRNFGTFVLAQDM